MADKTYKIVDVVGVSEESIHQAVRNALKKASQTLRHLDWFEVQNIRGAVNSKGEPPLRPGRVRGVSESELLQALRRNSELQSSCCTEAARTSTIAGRQRTAGPPMLVFERAV